MSDVKTSIPGDVLELLERMDAMATEIMDPMLCREPAYGVPGHAHCAACCYNLGYIVTCDADQAMVDAALALVRAVKAVRRA